MRKLIVVLAAVAFVAAFTLPAVAAEWSFYGNARMWTEWESTDKEVPAGLLGASGVAGFDDDELIWTLQSNSRIGATVKAGDIGGRFEYGTGINLRRLYGTWNFGAGTLLFGQDYTPVFYPVSDQCGFGGGDCGLIFWGTTYTGRVPQIRLNMGGFSVGLMDMGSLSNPLSVGTPAGFVFDTTTGGSLPVAAVPGFDAVDTDATLPEIEAAYNFSFGPGAFHIGGGYHTHDAVGVSGTTEKDYSVDAWFVDAAAKFAFGPLYVNGFVGMGENTGNYGLTQDILYKSAAYDSTTDSVEDAETLWFALIAGFKVSDMLKLEAGYGYISGERDLANVSSEQTTSTWYVQAAISPVKNVFIIPEIGVIDYGDNEVGGAETDIGSATYFGVKWQINF